MNSHKYFYNRIKLMSCLVINLILLPISSFAMLELDTKENKLQAITACDFDAKLLIERSPKCGILGGVVSVWVTGNQEPVTYFWKTDEGGMFSTGTNNTLENVPANITHWAIIRDASGCEIMLDFELAEQVCYCPLTARAVINKYPECGEPNGSVRIDYSGDQGEVTFESDSIWGDFARRDDLRAGPYSVTLTDEAGCKVTVDFDLTESTCCQNYGATAIVNQLPDCGESNGSVRIEVVGQNGAVTYSWGEGNQRDNLAAGEYWVVVKDVTGCSVTVYFKIEGENCCVDSDLTARSDIHQQPECGQNNGGVSIIPTGGVAPYTYSWGGQTHYDNLVPGDYQVTVTDAFGCTVEVNFELRKPANCCTDPNFKAEAVINQQPECGKTNGAVSINATGGVAPYKYSWGEQSSYDNLIPGNYIVTVTDALGCPLVVNFTLIQEDCCKDTDLAATAIINQHPECGKNNGSVNLEVTGGQAPYAYSWGGQSSYENLIPGDYTVTITDAFNCSTEVIFELIEGSCCPNFTVELAIKDPTNCNQNDGAVNFIIMGTTGNLTYTWDDGLVNQDSFRTDLSDRTYEVTITDDLIDCQQIIRLPLKTFTGDCTVCDLAIRTEVNDPSCDGGDGKVCIVATSSNGTINYLWEDGTTAACRENLLAGTYSVTISDDSCSIDTSIILVNPINCCDLTLETELSPPSCEGIDGKICLMATSNNGAINYLWEDGINTACRENLSAGIYQVTITSGDNCRIDTSFILMNPPGCCDLTIGAEVTPPNCNENDGEICMIAISSSETISYLWEDNTTGICREGLAAGTYRVTVSDGVCEKDTMIILSDSMSILRIIPDTLCADTSIGGIDYELMGCFALPVDIIILDESDEVIIMFRDTLGKGRIEGLLPNRAFTMVVTTANGEVIHRRIFRVIIPEKPRYELFRDTTLCDTVDMTEIRVSLVGNATFTWSTTPTFEDTLSKEAVLQVPIGNYYIALDAGCITMDSVIVKDGRIMVELLEPDPLCMPSTIALEVMNLKPLQTLSYVWTPKEQITAPTDTTASPEVNISETTQFNVTINNQFGCELMDSVTVMIFDTNLLADIRVIPNPEKIAATTTSILSLSNTPLPDGFTLEWQPDPTLTDNGETATVEPVENGTRYFANIFSEVAPQCAVTRDTAIWIGCDDDALFIPNAFSPNGDGINDVLFVRGADGLVSMNFIIYNRWGEQVFESSDPDFGWDGTFKGEELGPDVYGYYLTITCPIGGKALKGNVTLLR